MEQAPVELDVKGKVKDWISLVAVIGPLVAAFFKSEQRYEILGIGLAVLALLALYVRLRRDQELCEKHRDRERVVNDRLRETMAEMYRAIIDTSQRRGVDFPDFGRVMSGEAVFRWNPRPKSGGKRASDPPEG